MTTTTHKQTVTVTTDCLCGEGDTDTLTEYCSGECYEWQKEDVFALLGEWYVVNGIEEDDPILIPCDRMTWQGIGGYKWTTPMELDGALSLNGDFKIEWYLEDGETLTARRWSHDEPMGTGLFHFTAHKECVKCGTPVCASIHKEELGMCVECSNAYFDHKED
jgi:hypothetical protein